MARTRQLPDLKPQEPLLLPLPLLFWLLPVHRPLPSGLDVRYRVATVAAVTDADVQEAMDQVLALDAAYPLPLLPGMLEESPRVTSAGRQRARKEWRGAAVGSQMSRGRATAGSRLRGG